MKRKLLFAIVALLCSVATWAYQTPTADGIYYIQNVNTGKFLCRGNAWGTRAVVSDFGSAWKLVEDNGKFHVRVASLVGASVNQGIGDDYWMYADCSGDRDRTYTLTLISDGQYTMTGSGISMNVYAYTKDDADKFSVAGNAILNDNMTSIDQSYWRFLSQSEYDAVIAGRISTQESAVATSAGYDLSTLDKTLAELVGDVNSFANKGVQATVTATTGWTWTPETNRNGGTGTGSNLVEAFKSPGKFTKTITGLTEGIYKVSVPALFRESNNEACYSLHESGFEPSGGCYISANGNTTSVSSWASGATSNSYPNSMAEAKARIDAGAYSNELYCYVDDSGNLNLEVGVPGWYEVSQWVGSWYIMGDATATLYSDAVSLDDAAAILSTATTLEGEEMNADLLSALSSAKSTFNGARTIANYNALQTAIVAAQESADAYALFAPERTKALALGLTSEAIAALAPNVHALKVAEYNFVTTNYAYGVDLGAWTTTGETATNKGQHWDGTGSSTYLEQLNRGGDNPAGWHAGSWEVGYSQDINLPAGNYVFKVAGRRSSESVTLSLKVKKGDDELGSVNDFPNGDTGKGIDTSGATNFGDGTFANNGTGRGWQWRYVKFTLANPATVNVAVSAVASAQYQWMSFCNATVQTDDEKNIELMEALVNLNSAITTATLTKNTTNVGTGVFQLDEDTNDALWSAYVGAKGDAEDYELTSSSTASEVNDLVTALNTAISNYQNQELNTPADGKKYYIKVATTGHAKEGKAIVLDRIEYPHYNGNYIDNQTGFTLNASAAPAEYLAQAATFTQVSGNTYNISIEREEGTVYLTYGSLNDSKVNWKEAQIQATTESSKKGEFKIVATTTENVFNIVNTTATGGTIACQDGGNIYTEVGNADFTLEEASQASVTVSAKAGKYGTVIFPFTPDVSDGFDNIAFYSCAGINENGTSLLLVDVVSPAANTPYIIKNNGGDDFSESLTGWGTAAADNYKTGLLTGVLKSDIDIPSGSYMLATNNNTGVQAFYQIDGTGVKCAINKCYLTVPAPGVKAFFFNDDDVDAINGVEVITEKGSTIYNLAGQRVQKPTKGLYIVNGRKVLVK